MISFEEVIHFWLTSAAGFHTQAFEKWKSLIFQGKAKLSTEKRGVYYYD